MKDIRDVFCLGKIEAILISKCLDSKKVVKRTKVLHGKFSLQLLYKHEYDIAMCTRDNYVVNIDEHKEMNILRMES